MEALHVYDTTLRDGAQQEGLNLGVGQAGHRRAARRPRGRLHRGRLAGSQSEGHRVLRAGPDRATCHATLAAFGATRRAGSSAAEDPLVAALLNARTSVVCLVAKSHVRHVEEALRTTLEENLEMVRDTVGHLVAAGKRVFLDAEHFFDGWHLDRDYALAGWGGPRCGSGSHRALCDTNGGMLPHVIEEVVADVIAETGARVGRASATMTRGAPSQLDRGRAGRGDPRPGNGQRLWRADGNRRSGHRRGEPPVQARPRRDGSRLVPEAVHVAHAISEATCRPTAASPYVGARAFRAQGRPPRAHSRWTRNSTSTWTPSSWAMACAPS